MYTCVRGGECFPRVQRCRRRFLERSGVFLDGDERFTQPFADLGGHLTQGAEDIFLARHLRLLVGEDVAGGAVLRPQGEDVLTAQAGDRAIEHRGACRSNAHALSDLGSQPRIRRLLHHRQRFSDAVIRNEAEERRLLKLCRESLAQRVVEHRIARRIGEFGRGRSCLCR